MIRWTKSTYVAVGLALTFGAASAQTTNATAATTHSPQGQTRVAAKFAAPFVTLAGSNENAVALATALRNGTPVTLTYTTAASDGRPPTTTSTTITPPTKPMGWGNVSHALALAQFSLTQIGITNPTGAQLQAALVGGTVTAADGTSVALTGVLQQRASGMGWGQIAQIHGTTMGAVNRDIKTHSVAAKSTSIDTQSASLNGGARATHAATGVTTAAGGTMDTSSRTRGMTTAAGAAAQPDAHASKGLATAGSSPAAGRGIVTASGGSVAASTGIVHGGSSAGVVTAAGNTMPQDAHKPNNGKGKGG